jgi:uncharacterized protein (DUF952 family)
MMLYHLALACDWEAARAAGEYRRSTLGAGLDEVGFVHAAFAHQVAGVADRYYAGVTEPLVLLHLDEARLRVPWQVDPVPGSPEGFPHVYGPIDLAAVVEVTPVTRTADGTWRDLPV